MKNKRIFNVNDIDANIVVEISTRKEIFSWLNDFIDNLPYEWFSSDDTYSILYNDGSFDYIDINYDGHKIKKQNIKSLVFSNDCTYMVYGSFEINNYGVVTVSDKEIIAAENITEIKI